MKATETSSSQKEERNIGAGRQMREEISQQIREGEISVTTWRGFCREWEAWCKMLRHTPHDEQSYRRKRRSHGGRDARK